MMLIWAILRHIVIEMIVESDTEEELLLDEFFNTDSHENNNGGGNKGLYTENLLVDSFVSVSSPVKKKVKLSENVDLSPAAF